MCFSSLPVLNNCFYSPTSLLIRATQMLLCMLPFTLLIESFHTSCFPLTSLFQHMYQNTPTKVYTHADIHTRTYSRRPELFFILFVFIECVRYLTLSLSLFLCPSSIKRSCVFVHDLVRIIMEIR
jgi:hypothetical protein